MMTILQLLILFYLAVVATSSNGENSTTAAATKEGDDGEHRAVQVESSGDYYKHVGDVDELHSNSVIRSLPIMHFFDHDKRSFKMGFLGQEMLKTRGKYVFCDGRFGSTLVKPYQKWHHQYPGGLQNA